MAKESLLQILTPIWTSDMGIRLKNARQSMLMSQAEFGEKLGMTQQMIARLEKGLESSVTKNYIEWADALGKLTNYVFFGTSKEKVEVPGLNKKYWKVRLSTCGQHGEINKEERQRLIKGIKE